MRIVSLGLASLLLLAACGGSSEQGQDADLATLDQSAETESTEVASEPDGEIDQEMAMAKYEACMADHGVEIEAFDVGVGGVDLGEGIGDDEGAPPEFSFEEYQEADAECGSILEDAFGDFEMSPEDEARLADEMLEMQKCLDEKGFDIDLSGGSFVLDDTVDFDEFQKAMTECTPEGSFEVGSDG